MADQAPVEVELKLLFKAEDERKLRNCAALRPWKQGRATTQTTHSIYYDTPELDLAKTKTSFRVRKVGRAFVQTLKAKAIDMSGLQARPEWEWTVPQFSPDPSLTSETPLADQFSKIGETLTPVFETAFKRSKVQLVKDDCEVELCIDVGQISSGSKQEPLFEMELELKKGAPAFLYEIALAIHETVPLTIAADTKAQRGYALFTGAKPGWEKGGSIELESSWTVETTFQKIVRANMANFLANRDCAILGEDPEGIHQARVGLRRLRSAFSLFKDCLPVDEETQALKEDVKWLASSMGDARDWDVFMGETFPAATATLHGDEGLEVIAQEAKKLQTKGYSTSTKALASPKTTEIMLKLGKWVEERAWRQSNTWTAQTHMEAPVTELAHRLLAKRWKKVVKYGKKFDNLTIEQRHEMRIEVKKMRYATDFFGSLYASKKVKAFRSAYANIQDALGLLNDIAVTEHRLEEIPTKKPEVFKAMGRILGWQQHIANGELEKVSGYWKELAKNKPYWEAKNA